MPSENWPLQQNQPAIETSQRRLVQWIRSFKNFKWVDRSSEIEIDKIRIVRTVSIL